MISPTATLVSLIVGIYHHSAASEITITETLVIEEVPDKSIFNLTQDDLLRHTHFLTAISNTTVSAFGSLWRLDDICIKPSVSGLDAFGELGGLVHYQILNMMPCVIVTPLDCFWEGSKPLGPFPPLIVSSEVQIFVPSLSSRTSWKNLDLDSVIRDVGALFDIESECALCSNITSLGIGDAYQRLPCVDPMDEECPKSAPNSVDWCKITEVLLNWSRENNENHTDFFVEPKDSEEAQESSTSNIFDYFTDLFGPEENDEASDLCNLNKGSAQTLLRQRPELIYEALPEDLRPKVAKVQESYWEDIARGCKGFSKELFKHTQPSPQLERAENALQSQKKLQSFIMLASAQDVFEKFSTNATMKTLRSPNEARNVIGGWKNEAMKHLQLHGRVEYYGYQHGTTKN